MYLLVPTKINLQAIPNNSKLTELGLEEYINIS